jgi:OmpA-OmpF porin, OOP family
MFHCKIKWEMRGFETTYEKFRLFRINLGILILTIFLSSSSFYVSGSPEGPDQKQIKDLKTKAIRYDRSGDIYNAIEYYRQYLSFKTKDIKLSYRLANLYFNSRDYIKANQYFDSVIKIDRNKYLLSYYNKGIVCMNLGYYDKAKEFFTKFRSLYESKKDRHYYRKLASNYIIACDWAKTNLTEDKNIIIEHQGEKLNHPDIDFAAFPIDEKTILYGTAENSSLEGADRVRQIYKGEKVDGIWISTGILEGEINNPEFNTGNAVVSTDGKNLFFTRTRKNWQNKYVSEIFVSHMEGDNWQKPEKLPSPINLENYTSTQPALGGSTKSGNIIFFVSDRPGGKGGTDIWVTEYDSRKGTFKNPVDLSNKVNSPGDECSPFYDISTQTLYFSSKGRKEILGGFDIYKSTGSTRQWTEAVPLPKPLNSTFDDYYFSIQKNNKEGFFSSNRPGSLSLNNGNCCDDIFTFKTSECVSIHSVGTVRNSVNYDFYDLVNKKYNLNLKYPGNNSLISEVPVELYLTQETEKDEVLISKTATDLNGIFTFELLRDKEYRVLVKNYGYFEKSVRINTFNKFCSDTIEVGTTLINYLPKVTIQVNIYYEFDKYRLTEEARKTIDSMVMPLFDMFPTGIIEIGSHTDNLGTDQYNIDLSQKRSESVVSYIVSRGISPERLVARGYGMRVPVAPNTNPDGSDYPEGRQLNRRTEIRVVGQLSEKNDL